MFIIILKTVFIKPKENFLLIKKAFNNKKDETFLVAKGKVLLKMDDKDLIMTPGDRIRIKPGEKHSFGGLEAYG